MTSTEIGPRKHTGAAHTKPEAGSNRKLLEAGEVSEEELAQEEAEDMNVKYVAPAPPPKHGPPCLQPPAEPEAVEPASSFNLCMFRNVPKDTVAKGRVFPSDRHRHVYSMLFLYSV